MNGSSDMIATWQFNSVTQATVTVESCSTNCLWQSGQVITFNKFFGDNNSDCACNGVVIDTRWCDNGDGTITDLTTCLVWLKKADWGGYIELAEAYSRVAILSDGTQDAELTDGSKPGDWRIPTVTEGCHITDKHYPAYVSEETPRAFTGVNHWFYWTSTTFSYQGIDFSNAIGTGPYTQCWWALQNVPTGLWPIRGGN